MALKQQPNAIQTHQYMRYKIGGNYISLIKDYLGAYEVGIFIKDQGSAVKRFANLKDAKSYYKEQKDMMNQYSYTKKQQKQRAALMRKMKRGKL